MTFAPPRLLARLRRHRGAWLLAMAVLVIKLVASTFCIMDGPRIASVPATAIQSIDNTAAADDGACSLGEGSGCHCACAHAVAMPVSATLVPALLAVDIVTPRVSSTTVLRVPDAPLRPPIA